MEGYDALGRPPPWLPLSMTPDETLETLFFSLPAIGMVVAVLYFDVDARWCSAALLAGTLGNVLLGALQATAGSSWHLYEITNTGAVGFFANRNFMGSLLVVSVPFAAALTTFLSRRSAQAKWPAMVMGSALVVLLLVGLALNQSLAATLLIIPVGAASLALLPGRFDLKRIAVGAAALLALAAIALIMGSSVPLELSGADTTTYETRREIWAKTLTILHATFPFGTGLGSFPAVYALFEDPTRVDRFYVNAAHNDFLQWSLELGAVGVLLAITFLGWWAVQVYRIWKAPIEDVFARAATLASGALLAHSLVDYPLRTAALSAIFAYCIGTVGKRRTSGARFEHPNIRSPRHVHIG
jgi:O-antigen ligase